MPHKTASSRSALVLVVLLLAGCLPSCATKAGTGTAVGAGAGAGAGAIIGHQSGNKGKGALIGAAVGAGAGYLIGKSQDDADADAARPKGPEKTSKDPSPPIE